MSELHAGSLSRDEMFPITSAPGIKVRVKFTPTATDSSPQHHPAVSTGACTEESMSLQNDTTDVKSLNHFDECVAELKEGNAYYLLDADWWHRFKADETDPALFPIDNSGVGPTVVVSPEAWSAFVAKYGGGPPLCRLAVKAGGVARLSAVTDTAVTCESSDFLKWLRDIDHDLNDCGTAPGVELRCFVCRRKAPSKCKRCKTVSYCSQDCQKAHWQSHKRWCATASNIPGLDSTAFKARVGINKRGRTGLNNLGNTCFLSSGLQCLSHVVPLTSYFLSGEYKSDLNVSSKDGTRGQLADKYELLLRELWFGETASVSPLHIKGELGKKDSIYHGLQQQDAHEFLERFLDWLQEDVNRVTAKPYCERPEGDGSDDCALAADSWAKDKLRNDSVINALMGGQMRSQLDCEACARRLVRFDYFHTMQLAIPAQAPAVPPADAAVLVKVLYLPVSTEFSQLGQRPRELEISCGITEDLNALSQRLLKLLGEAEDEAVVFLRLSTDALSAANPVLLEPTTVVGVLERDPQSERFVLAAYKRGQGIPCFLTQDGDRVTIGYLQLMFVNGKDSLARMRFNVWLQVRRIMRNEFWSALNGGGDSGVDESLAAVNDVKLNFTLAAALPLISIDDKDCPVKAAAGVMTPKSLAKKTVKDDKLQAVLQTMGLGDVSASMREYVVPSDKDATVEALCESLGGDGILRLCVHWTDEWRVQCDLQETFKVSRPKASAAPLPKSSLSIQQCLRLFSSPERLDADNLWYCSACKVHRQALKTVKLWRLPEVLVLTLKRFEVRESSVSGWRGASSMNVKIDSPVEFPINGLDLREFCHEAAPLQGGSTYDLFAVCNHFGRMGFGHYTAFARDWAGPSLSEEWSAFDDESVTPSSEEEVLRSMRSAYILFYRKRPVTTVESSHS